MNVVCLSDIHNRFENLDKALTAIAAHRADALICCGDLETGMVLARIADNFPGEIHVVRGNNDSEDDIKATIDRERLLRVYYHQLQGRLTVGKRRVAFTHKPKDAEILLTEGFDVVFHGHTHEADVTTHNQTIVVCPGDIQGRYQNNPSYALYDTETGEVSLHTVT